MIQRCWDSCRLSGCFVVPQDAKTTIANTQFAKERSTIQELTDGFLLKITHLWMIAPYFPMNSWDCPLPKVPNRSKGYVLPPA